jgi:hypothetical protein
MNREATTVVPACIRITPIRRGDTVFHELSKRKFLCMDNKQERWMNQNPLYTLLFKAR